MRPAGGHAWRADIDGLRAVAVIAVVLFHLGVGFLPGGYVGVDVFFVISGYLITGIIGREIEAGRFSLVRFYERRVRRIAPALVVVLAATFLAASLIQAPRDYRSFARTLIATPLFASNFMFLGGEGYFDPASGTKPLLHTWSLGVEEQFYIVFPWLVLVLAQLSRRRRLMAVAAVIAASLAASALSAAGGIGSAYYLLPTRFWELGAGALIALAGPRPGAGARRLLSVGGLAAIAAAALLYDAATPFPGWAALLPVAGAAAVILGEGGPANRLIARGPFVFFGRISYPMYLWHWPLIVFFSYVSGHPPAPAAAAAIFAAVVALSVATLHFVEAPIRSRRILAAPAHLFAAGGIAGAALIMAGIVGFAFDGWPTRLPGEVRALANVALERTALEDVCPHGRRDFGWNLPPCILGDAASARFGFAILGDSHGEALAGAIGAEAARLGIKGLWLGRIACPPLKGVDRPDDPTRRCAAHLDWALGRIAESGAKTVLIIGRWGYFLDHRQAAGPMLAVNGRAVPAGDDAQAVAEGLEATLAAIGPRPVAFLRGIPEPGFDVPTATAASLRFGRPAPAGPTEAQWLARRGRDEAPIMSVLARHANVEVIDPVPLLCGGGTCGYRRGTALLFVDSNHLSRAGAALVAPLFADFLLRHAQ